jgi:hypothetical protein
VLEACFNGTPQFFLDPLFVFPARWIGELIPSFPRIHTNLPDQYPRGVLMIPQQQPYFPPPMQDTIWRNDKTLVMMKQALLPNRCVKCNAFAEEQLHRKLTWHHPALYLLVLVSILIYAIVAMCVRKTASINVGLCEDHLSTRRRNLLITWALGFASIASFVAAGFLEDGTFVLVGIALLFTCAIYGIVTLRVVVPSKIDDYFVWLKGVDTNYLQQFPEWRGQA